MVSTYLTNTQPIERLRERAALFCAIRHIDDLEALLDVSEYELHLLSLNPKYHIFSVPKKDGSKRWIEDPEDDLQFVQDKLNDFLQSIYYLRRTDAAYGFMLCPKGDPEPRQIISNAARHLGAPWLFNADIEDFFHQVTFERVFQIFKGEPFTFEDELAQLLTRLTTHQERLPMGAPTSPVLSNFATVKLDGNLQQLADWAGWTYTRYADDMVFSSQKEITSENIAQIRQIIEDEGYTLKEKKLRLYRPEEVKRITGLALSSNKVIVPNDFTDLIQKELVKLQHLIEVHHRTGRHKAKWVEKYKQQIAGRVNFLCYVMGDDDLLSQQITNQYKQAIRPPEDYDAVSWLDFPYF